MTSKRSGFGAFVDNGWLYIAGGNDGIEIVPKFEKYDIKNNFNAVKL